MYRGTHKHDSVVKVLEQVDYKEGKMSSEQAMQAGLLSADSESSIPAAETEGFTTRFDKHSP